MLNCIYCDAVTLLIVNGAPICLECDARIDAGQWPSTNPLFQVSQFPKNDTPPPNQRDSSPAEPPPPKGKPDWVLAAQRDFLRDGAGLRKDLASTGKSVLCQTLAGFFVSTICLEPHRRTVHPPFMEYEVVASIIAQKRVSSAPVDVWLRPGERLRIHMPPDPEPRGRSVECSYKGIKIEVLTSDLDRKARRVDPASASMP